VKDRTVDPDEPTLGVDECTAGIAHVDRGVGLDEIFVAPTSSRIFTLRPLAETMPIVTSGDFEWIADGEDERADAKFVAVASVTVEIFRFDFDHAMSVFGSARSTLGDESRSSPRRTFIRLRPRPVLLVRI